MKKRIVLSGLLAAALTLSLTACGGDKMPEETPVPTPIQTSHLNPDALTRRDRRRVLLRSHTHDTHPHT